MAATDYKWEESLTEEDEKLIRAYESVGEPLDSLAYTRQFDELVRLAGFGDSDESKHDAFMRLLNLRKRGRLPRLTHRESA